MVSIQLYVENGRFVTAEGDKRRAHQDVGDAIEYLHGISAPYMLDCAGIPKDVSEAVERAAGRLNGEPAVFVGYSHDHKSYFLKVRNGVLEGVLSEKDFLNRIRSLRVGNQGLAIANTGLTVSDGP